MLEVKKYDIRDKKYEKDCVKLNIRQDDEPLWIVLDKDFLHLKFKDFIRENNEIHIQEKQEKKGV